MLNISIECYQKKNKNKSFDKKKKWRVSDSNTQPSALEADALPLRQPSFLDFVMDISQINDLGHMRHIRSYAPLVMYHTHI